MTWVVLTSSPDYIVLYFIISIWREFINLFKLYLNLWKTINSRCHRTRKFVSKFSIPMNTYRITKWNCSPPVNKQFILADNVCKFILSFFQYPFCSASTYSSNFFVLIVIINCVKPIRSLISLKAQFYLLENSAFIIILNYTYFLGKN